MRKNYSEPEGNRHTVIKGRSWKGILLYATEKYKMIEKSRVRQQVIKN